MNDDEIELLERRLSEKVTERVRPALFRVYATIGAAVIATLGALGWDIVSDIKSEIKQEIRQEIDDSIIADIEKKRTEIIGLIAETRFLAKEANAVVVSLDKKINQFEPQARQLDETIAQVASLNVEAQNLMAMYSTEIEPLKENVAALVDQLKLLAEQVNQLNLAASDAKNADSSFTINSVKARSSAIAKVISKTSEVERQFKDRNKTTVFFQFAGASRGQAEELSEALKKQGYIIPGEDREPGAARKHEVRYFHLEDEKDAQRLAETTTRTLERLGYNDNESMIVKAVSFVSYSGKKPKPGVIELWLELPYLAGR